MLQPRTHRPRILFAHDRGGIGGAGRILYTFLRHFDPRKFSPVVILGTDGPLVERIRELGIPCKVVPVVELWPLPTEQFRVFQWMSAMLLDVVGVLVTSAHLVREVLRWKPDVIYANGLAVQLASVILRGLYKGQVIWHVHNVQPEGFRWRLFRLLLRTTPDRIIFVSRYALELLGDVDAEKSVLVYNGVPQLKMKCGRERVRASLGVGLSDRVVAYVGALRRSKGIEVLLCAFRLVHEKHPDTRLIIIGEEMLRRERGYRRSLEQLSRNLGIDSSVRFTGYRQDSQEIIWASDVLVLPSTSPEALPTVVLEAMAASCPVVASAVGGVLELIEHGKTGLLVPPGDVYSLAMAIEQILTQSELARNLGRNAYLAYQQRFTEERFAREVEKVIRDVVEL